MIDDTAFDLEVEIGGRQYFVARTLDVARRVEQAVGAIEPFARRLETGAVTFVEAGRLYGALLRAETDPPAAKDIDAWLFSRGLFEHRNAAFFLMALIIGSQALAREQARLAATLKPAKGDARGPFAPAAASTGSF